MSFFFSKPKMPAVQAPVTDDTAEVQAAARAEADRLRKKRGVRSTILTGSRGLTDTPSTLRTTLG